MPIPITSDSYNRDIVVEKTAPSPIVPVTTASMDGGLANTNYSWFERGYNSIWPGIGLSTAGSTNNDLPDHLFVFAPDYKTNNATMVDSVLTTATLTAVTPGPFSRLSFLTSSGNGAGVVQYIVHYQNGSSQAGTFTSPDWMNSVGAAICTYGCVNVNLASFDGVNENRPSLFARDVTLTNTNSPITSIAFNFTSGAAHTAILAVSGSTNLVDAFSPIPVTGFNVDLVVESTAPRHESLSTATTGSMEGGFISAGRTWYEKGYYILAPSTGLPPAGSTLTNITAPDHRYVLAPSYISNNNAVVFDTDYQSATLTPILPTAGSALSFLCASGHGPTTNQSIISHANGLDETNVVVIPDWFDASSAAFISSGDLNLNYRTIDSAGANNPRLFAIDVPLTDTQSTVTNVAFNFIGGGPNSHAAVLAMSISTTQSSGIRPFLSIAPIPAGKLRITTSQPGQLQSTTALKGTNTVWQNEGNISSTLDLTPTAGISGKYYRVIGQ